MSGQRSAREGAVRSTKNQSSSLILLEIVVRVCVTFPLKRTVGDDKRCVPRTPSDLILLAVQSQSLCQEHTNSAEIASSRSST